MEFEKLKNIMVRLRQECPWDKKQTRDSLKPYLIEETYELLEAIEHDEPTEIKEELGDLLLQIMFHARIAEEDGDFNIEDVIEGISNKMINRHPHVFGHEKFDTPEQVVEQWEERKKEEGKLRNSILEGVPNHMPALLRAHRLSSRAAGAGFEWEHIDDVLSKLEEEIAEFREALKLKQTQNIEEELGDIFFVLVNIARFVDVNPEDALRKTISKFIRRFRHIEMHASDAGIALKDMSLEQMQSLWDAAKRQAK